MGGRVEKRNLIKIADIAGVSLTTASRVFSNHPYVKASTRKKVIDAAHQVNYEPRVSVSKRNVGIVVESLEHIDEDRYLATILSYMARTLSANSFGFDLIAVRDLDKLEYNFIKTAVAILYQDKSIEKVKACSNTNFIMINNVVDGMSCVCSDHREGIRLAYNYLKGHGHERIALFMSHFEGWGSIERRESFLELCRENDCADGSQFLKDSSSDVLSRSVQDILYLGVTAIIIAPEHSVLRVMSELNRLGVKVPDDLSVVSFENIGVSQYIYPAHTTISQGFDGIVNDVVKLVGESMSNTLTMPQTILRPNRLIERESVRRLE